MKKLIIITTIFLLIVGVISATLATTAGAKQVEPEPLGSMNNPSKPDEVIHKFKLVGTGIQGKFADLMYGASAYITNPNDEPITLERLSVYDQDGSENYTGYFVIIDYDSSTLDRSLKLTIDPHETIFMRFQYYKWIGNGEYENPTEGSNWKGGGDVTMNELFNVISFEIEYNTNKSSDPLVGYMSQVTWDPSWIPLAKYYMPLVNLER